MRSGILGRLLNGDPAYGRMIHNKEIFSFCDFFGLAVWSSFEFGPGFLIGVFSEVGMSRMGGGRGSFSEIVLHRACHECRKGIFLHNLDSVAESLTVKLNHDAAEHHSG